MIKNYNLSDADEAGRFNYLIELAARRGDARGYLTRPATFDRIYAENNLHRPAFLPFAACSLDCFGAFADDPSVYNDQYGALGPVHTPIIQSGPAPTANPVSTKVIPSNDATGASGPGFWASFGSVLGGGVTKIAGTATSGASNVVSSYFNSKSKQPKDKTAKLAAIPSSNFPWLPVVGAVGVGLVIVMIMSRQLAPQPRYRRAR